MDRTVLRRIRLFRVTTVSRFRAAVNDLVIQKPEKSEKVPLTYFCSNSGKYRLIFTAPGYAREVGLYAVVVCPSVCPSVCQSATNRYRIETTGQIELSFGMEASFHLAHAVS